MSIADTLANVRQALTESGIPEYTVTPYVRDQAQASFRVDMVSLCVDPANGLSIEAALAGMLVGMKCMIQQDLPLPLISQYVGVCEALLPLLGQEPVDVSGLPSMDFLNDVTLPAPAPPRAPEPRYSCSKCGGPDAIVPVGQNGIRFCVRCAGDLVYGGMQAMRLSGNSPRPQVGGPGFQRGPDPAPEAPQRWYDQTFGELFGRLRKKRH